MTTQKQLIQFIKDNYDGDMDLALSILKKNIPSIKKPGSPGKNRALELFIYSYIENRVTMSALCKNCAENECFPDCFALDLELGQAYKGKKLSLNQAIKDAAKKAKEKQKDDPLIIIPNKKRYAEWLKNYKKTGNRFHNPYLKYD